MKKHVTNFAVGIGTLFVYSVIVNVVYFCNNRIWDKESIWDHIAMAVIIVIVYTYVTKEGSEYSDIHGASKRH